MKEKTIVTPKVYDVSNWESWNAFTEIMEGGEVWGLEEKVNSVWDMLSLDGFETFL